MTDNQIGPSRNAQESFGLRALRSAWHKRRAIARSVQGVPDGDAGHQANPVMRATSRPARPPRGIGYEEGAAGRHGGKFVGYQTT